MRELLGVTVHHDLASFGSTSGTMLTLKAAWVGKIIAIHVTEFSKCALYLHQCLGDEDGWN